MTDSSFLLTNSKKIYILKDCTTFLYCALFAHFYHDKEFNPNTFRHEMAMQIFNLIQFEFAVYAWFFNFFCSN